MAKEIMLGILDPAGYEKVNRVYSPKGLTPTITSRDYKDPIKIVDMERRKYTILEDKTRQDKTRQDKTRQDKTRRLNCRVIGQMDNTIDHTFESANRVYDNNALCPTIPTGCGGGHIPKVLTREIK